MNTPDNPQDWQWLDDALQTYTNDVARYESGEYNGPSSQLMTGEQFKTTIQQRLSAVFDELKAIVDTASKDNPGAADNYYFDIGWAVVKFLHEKETFALTTALGPDNSKIEE